MTEIQTNLASVSFLSNIINQHHDIFGSISKSSWHTQADSRYTSTSTSSAVVYQIAASMILATVRSSCSSVQCQSAVKPWYFFFFALVSSVFINHTKTYLEARIP